MRPNTREQIESRFEWQGECLVWTGGRFPAGYGHACFQGREYYTHRLVWEWNFGIIPKGKFVLHACDNPPCGNPEHLFLGTNADNTADMISKGRKASTAGEKNGQAKLTRRDVRKIRARLQKGEGRTSISKEFGVSPATIWDIKLGRTWKEGG